MAVKKNLVCTLQLLLQQQGFLYIFCHLRAELRQSKVRGSRADPYQDFNFFNSNLVLYFLSSITQNIIFIPIIIA